MTARLHCSESRPSAVSGPSSRRSRKSYSQWAPRRRRGAGIAQHQRDVEGGVEIAVLADHPVIAELLAVIGGDDDQRPLIGAARAQGGKETAELVIDLADHAVIGGTH